MLTRLQVDGFKNLGGVDLRFGPFTCVAGPNGVGKSNLFDAIGFLAALASRPLAEAAAQVRGTEGRVGDVRALFSNVGGERAPEMGFVAELVVPNHGVDDLGFEAEASMTFLRYSLRLRHREEASALGPLEVVAESMDYIKIADAKDALGFPHSAVWRKSIIGGRRTVPYIETVEEAGRRVVLVRQDSAGGLGGGGPRRLLASNLPRTVLSTATNAAEFRTLVLARKEMTSWVPFQLEPSALRSPDPFHAPRRIGNDGSHLPATLFGLGKDAEREGHVTAADVSQQVANRLAELFENVRTLRVDADEKREQHSIVLTDLQDAEHVASSLSDGTLRFLALAILEASPEGPALLCLEEPENGIHPDRVPAMIDLLRDIAVDVSAPVGPTNPMRQVIVNTHSQGVVQTVPEDSLLLASAGEQGRGGRRERPLRLSGVPGTWREPRSSDASLVALLPYLGPMGTPSNSHAALKLERRILDRTDVRQLLLPGLGESRR